MAHLVSDTDKLAGFLPRLTELLERNRLLNIVDNAESLLNGTGRWLDERWGEVIDALTAHRGLGRVIITSRRVLCAFDAVARNAPAETPRPR